MRLREQVIGALNLFRVRPGAFDATDVRIGQALADVATISLLHERNLRHSDTLNEQLQAALNSRVVIEQAKGKLAERLGLDVNQAFSLLRDYARAHNQRLSDLARAFVDGTDALPGLATPTIRQPPADSRPEYAGLPAITQQYSLTSDYPAKTSFAPPPELALQKGRRPPFCHVGVLPGNAPVTAFTVACTRHDRVVVESSELRPGPCFAEY